MSLDRPSPTGHVPPPKLNHPTIGQSAPAGVAPDIAGRVNLPVDDKLHSASGGVDVGRVVEVTVDSASEKEVQVRLADGRPGVIARNEFSGTVAGGDTVRAALLAREDTRGRVWLSYDWARKIDGWERVEESLSNKTPLTGRVTKSVKGGFVVDLGIRTFLPVSHVPDAMHAALVGSDQRVVVIEADRDKNRIVVSIRDLQRRESRDQERNALKALEAGKRVNGTIESIADYGAVVDLDGARGLIPRRELSWGRVDSVGDVVKVGESVRVEVLDVNRTKRRITLSLRRTAPDPMSELGEGDLVLGTVTKVVEYGAFMRIGDTELEGLVHVSQLSEARSFDARELVIPGEQLQVRIIEIEPAKRRIALSVTAAI